MDDHQRLLRRLAQRNDQKMVLLVLDGVGDLRSVAQPQTALEAARLPNFDRLARASSLGRLVPVARGVTPGSGPGHLALFGYDPTLAEADIGRGVLEALGLGLDIGDGVVAARGNFATADSDGKLTDRRAGRISSAECQRLCARLSEAVEQTDLDLEADIHAGEGHRFVVLLKAGDDDAPLDPELADTDPQMLGVPPLEASTKPVNSRAAADEVADTTVQRVRQLIDVLQAAIADEPQANRVLLRGFSKKPSLPLMSDLYKLRLGAFAGYPLYRGVAGACGMEVVECPKLFADIVPVVAERWLDFDFFFIHVKQTDQAGEDGDWAAKVAVLEAVDAALPALLELAPSVLAVTGDHSTPAPMAAHSWHPVPLLLHADLAFIDAADRFGELAAISGALGTMPARDLIGVMLAHAGRLKKFGA